MKCNIDDSRGFKSRHTLLLCFVKKLPIEVLFFPTVFFFCFLFFFVFFFLNGRMLTSSDLDQRSANFGSASNSSEWCFLLKLGRFE